MEYAGRRRRAPIRAGAGIVAVALAILSGCSDDASNGEAEATGGGTGTGGTSSTGGSASGGGSSGGASGSGGTASMPVEPTVPVARDAGSPRGRLLFEKTFDDWTIHSAFDSAVGFREYGFACHLSTFEGCEVENCGFPEGDAEGTLHHPGTLTIENETTGMMVTVEPEAEPGSTAEAIYPYLPESMLVLSPGDSVRISAAGSAEIPAFTATLAVPAPLENAAATTEPESVNENAFLGEHGLGFSWAASDGLVLVQWSYGPYGFSGFDPSFNATAYCAYPRGDGMAGLSPAIIGHVGCSSHAVTALSAYSEHQVTAGDYAVTVQMADASEVTGYLDCEE